MGRIDEALRRSTQRTASPAVEGPQTERFDSPWSFDDDGGAGEARPVRRPASTPALVRPAIAPRDGVAIRLQDSGTWREAPGAGVSVSIVNPLWSDKLVISPNADSLLVEQFRQFAGSLHQAQAASNVRVVMVTSAEASEGKSLTSVNLALTLSQSYRRRVLLIDADLRRPRLHEITQVSDASGLGETLTALTDEKLPVFRLSETLSVVPAGRVRLDPMGAFASPRLARILSEARAQFDWVLVDAPPVGTLADATLLAAVVDTAVLVVRAGRTNHGAVQKAIDTLGRDRVFGVVLNGVEEAATEGYRRQYDAYAFDGDQKG